MNILALSPKHNLLLLAVQNNIYAFNLQNDGKIRDHETPKVYQVHQDDVKNFFNIQRKTNLK